jgi:hypothetical protein
MKKSDTFADRRQEAEAAKNRRVEKFRAKPDQANPEAAARTMARQAESAARAERKAAVDLEKRQNAERIRVEADAAAAANRLAKDQELQKVAQDAEAQSILDEAARKAKRDARYASRRSKP